ncbi:hypothetical protein BIY37_07135 [Candidatus Brocadia sapporoensis]|uniref:Uncharacterized protein n=1 Tax=Candidatus Brocadia sapporoensis TaxID=392547 RepID=A0A1V6M003_9BACT|nr:hypothetical protein BIY37_07135 [Candidatus Brocadia sapporoensis]TVL95319.1 MAG: hypothetical protein CV082_11310 [Candidatus Brocadia sp. BL1]
MTKRQRSYLFVSVFLCLGGCIITGCFAYFAKKHSKIFLNKGVSFFQTHTEDLLIRIAVKSGIRGRISCFPLFTEDYEDA